MWLANKPYFLGHCWQNSSCPCDDKWIETLLTAWRINWPIHFIDHWRKSAAWPYISITDCRVESQRVTKRRWGYKVVLSFIWSWSCRWEREMLIIDIHQRHYIVSSLCLNGEICWWAFLLKSYVKNISGNMRMMITLMLRELQVIVSLECEKNCVFIVFHH